MKDVVMEKEMFALPSEKSWGEMYVKFHDKLVTSLCKYFSVQDREDAVEEAFHKLMYRKQVESYGDAFPTSEKEWYWNLYWQAKSWLSHMKDRAGVHAKYVEKMVDELDDVLVNGLRNYAETDEDRRETIARCIESVKCDQDISTRDLMIFLALVSGEKTVPEIAQKYGLLANNVYVIKFRVRSALRDALERSGYRMVA